MPEKNTTTHVLMDKTLVVYRREHSSIWQCRYKVDGKWQRATTKESDLDKAKKKADELRIEAEYRKRANLPVVTRKFKHVALLAIDRMQDELNNGKGKSSYNDYIIVINQYLIPCLGNRNIANIDYAALNELEAWRITKMGKIPSHSTIQTHNAALNRVFDEALARDLLKEANKIKLEAKGQKSKRRAAFEMNEVRALLAGFESWIERGSSEEIKEIRLLMRDYVNVLLDTGARPGVELMHLKWNQIRSNKVKPTLTATGQFFDNREDGEDFEDGENSNEITASNLNHSVTMRVVGKTGGRDILGMSRTVETLIEIGNRNYDNVEFPLLSPLKDLIKSNNNDYVFRTRDKVDHNSSFQKMFGRYLQEHNLLVDPITEQNRVFYSLRHTYATFALTYDIVPLHTLTKQMGTSVAMIEKHYSHLNVQRAIEQLRGEESRQLIKAGGVIDAAYKFNEIAEAEARAKKATAKMIKI